MAGKALKILTGLVTTKWRDPQPCEACGEPFLCGATLAGCWCTEIKLSSETRARLKSHYERCLCRACLESLAQEEGTP
jgi:hypothetical protein